MESNSQLYLKWSNHKKILLSVFDDLYENETLVDCTLAAEGRLLQAHKLILSACSPYFAMVLHEHSDKFPILILKDVKYEELQAMMNYMYRGEVNISQDSLSSFLKAAESLQIKGLTHASKTSDSRKDAGDNVEKSHLIARQKDSQSTSVIIRTKEPAAKLSIFEQNKTEKTEDAENTVSILSVSTENAVISSQPLCSGIKTEVTTTSSLERNPTDTVPIKSIISAPLIKLKPISELVINRERKDESIHKQVVETYQDDDSCGERLEDNPSFSTSIKNDSNKPSLDGSLQIKEEEFSEVRPLQPTNKIRVRSPAQLLSSKEFAPNPSTYCVPDINEDKNRTLADTKSISEDSDLISENLPRTYSDSDLSSDSSPRKMLPRKCKAPALIPSPLASFEKFQTVSKSVKIPSEKVQKLSNQMFRKILPAPEKSLVSSAVSTSTVEFSMNSQTFTLARDMMSTACIPSSGPEPALKSPSTSQFLPEMPTELPRMICSPPETADDFRPNPGILLNNPSTRSFQNSADFSRLNGAELQPNIFLYNPNTQMMLLKSEVPSKPVYSKPVYSISGAQRIVQRPNLQNTTNGNNCRRKIVPALIPTKYRRIAPLPPPLYIPD